MDTCKVVHLSEHTAHGSSTSALIVQPDKKLYVIATNSNEGEEKVFFGKSGKKK